MKYIFALSNFGRQYEKNYHNLGLKCVEYCFKDQTPHEIKEKPNYIFEKYENICVIKSKVFMNESAKALLPIFSMYKVKLHNLIVLHDDLSVKPFEVKLKEGGGNAGHNGLRSLSHAVGSDFFRIRIGIGHPKDLNPHMGVSDYVLSNVQNIDDWNFAFEKAKVILNKWSNLE